MVRIWLLALAVWLAPATAARAQLERMPLARLPVVIQRDIVTREARCGVPPKVAYQAESVDAGAIGGPGHRDYFADDTVAYFQPPAGAVYHYGGEACAQNYVPGRFWMQRRGGGYKTVVFPYAQLYAGARDFIVATPDLDCGPAIRGRVVAGWSDCERFVKWDPRTERFRPITRDMLFEDTLVWARARGYRRVGE